VLQNSGKSSSNIFIFREFLNLLKSFNIRGTVADITLNKSFRKPHYQLYGQTKLFIVCRGSVPRINQQGREAEYSPPFSTAFAKVSNCISIVSIRSDIVHRDKFTFVLIVVCMFEWSG